MTGRWIAAAVGLVVVLFVAFVTGALVAASDAQSEGSMQGMDHSRMDMGGASEPAAGSASTRAYLAANTKMHAAMDISYTDDADVDFARGMIGHHQGAIDMARVQLEHGTDPALRRLSEETIAAQEAEIEFLENWLSERDR
jgi:uncharacterized protein (DUF305 family)